MTVTLQVEQAAACSWPNTTLKLSTVANRADRRGREPQDDDADRSTVRAPSGLSERSRQKRGTPTER